MRQGRPAGTAAELRAGQRSTTPAGFERGRRTSLDSKPGVLNEATVPEFDSRSPTRGEKSNRGARA